LLIRDKLSRGNLWSLPLAVYLVSLPPDKTSTLYSSPAQVETSYHVAQQHDADEYCSRYTNNMEDKTRDRTTSAGEFRIDLGKLMAVWK